MAAVLFGETATTPFIPSLSYIAIMILVNTTKCIQYNSDHTDFTDCTCGLKVYSPVAMHVHTYTHTHTHTHITNLQLVHIRQYVNMHHTGYLLRSSI